MKIYEGGQQYSSQQQLWEAILTSSNDIQAETLHRLTGLVDERLKVMSKKGLEMKICLLNYIKKKKQIQQVSGSDVL